MTPIVVSRLADEFTYLDQWFGPGRYRLAGRTLSYGANGRVYDVLSIATGKQSYRVTFDATRIRPPAPAGEIARAASAGSSWIVPAIIVTTVVGLCVYNSRKRRK